MAMLTTFNEIDLSAVQALRHEHQEAFQKRYQVKLGLMSFFVKAAIDALKQFPQLNAEIRGNDAVYFNYFDIGVAIAREHGLVVPVLRNAQSMSFAETEKAIGDFARRAENGRLKPDELEGGTFTITNGGIFGLACFPRLPRRSIRSRPPPTLACLRRQRARAAGSP